MRSPEDGKSREGAAFPHKEYSNLPHPVQALNESHSVLNYQDNKAIPSRPLCSCSGLGVFLTPPADQHNTVSGSQCVVFPISVEVEMDGLYSDLRRGGTTGRSTK